MSYFEGILETIGIICVIWFVVWGVAVSCEGRKYVAECVLKNPELLNVEEICESKWRLK